MSWISGPGISIAPGSSEAVVGERISYSIATQQENAVLRSQLQPGGMRYNDYDAATRNNIQNALNESDTALTNAQRSAFTQYPAVASQFPALASQLGFGAAAAAGVVALAAAIASAAPVDAPKQTDQTASPNTPFNPTPGIPSDLPVGTTTPRQPSALGMPLNYFTKKKFRLILDNSEF
jgi:hypothetical protein